MRATGARTHYFHVKGSAEDVLAALGFARASFYRPSLLVTRTVRYGLQDRLTQAILFVRQRHDRLTRTEERRACDTE